VPIRKTNLKVGRIDNAALGKWPKRTAGSTFDRAVICVSPKDTQQKAAGDALFTLT
jgi:hypothetical protein